MAKKPTSIKRPRKAPSSRARKYVRGVLKGKTKKAAKQAAGYSANTKAATIEKAPAVQQLFSKTLDALGVTDLLLGRRIYQGLFAMQTKTATLEGKITDRIHLVDFAERREYATLGLRLRGHLVERHEVRVGRLLEDILEDSHE